MSTSDRTADVLIVGSGPVGATFARLIAGVDGRHVTMIEAGPQLSARPGGHMANAFTYQQQPNLFLDIILAQLEVFSVPPSQPLPLSPSSYCPKLPRVNFENPDQIPELNMPLASASYAVGGMATHWTCCCPDPAPMERSPLIPEDEWPILLAIARKLLNVRTDAFSPSFNNEVMKAILREQGFAVTNLPKAAEKRAAKSPRAHMVTWTGVDTVLGPLLDEPRDGRASFQLVPEHRVEQLIVKGSKVEGAVVLDLASLTTSRIYAETVIVAAGSFLTPSILWRSRIRPAALGRYLNANQTVSSTVVINNEVIDRLRANPDNPAREDPIPMTWSDPPVMIGFDPTPDKPWHAQIQRTGHYLSYDLGSIGVNEPFTDARLVVDLIWFGMVEPQENNRITFSDALLDRFGQPQITIEYTVGVPDLKRADPMMDDMVRAALAIGGFIPKTGEPMVQSAGSTLHYHGTCRMGDDRGAASVVDPYSKVWGIDNLYLGSVGVIPNKMASNPTLTACALAVRAAARIIGRSITELARQVAITETV